MIVSIEICTGTVYNFLVAFDMIIYLMALYIYLLVMKKKILIVIFFNERFSKIYVVQPRIIIRLGFKRQYISTYLMAQNPPPSTSKEALALNMY